MQSVLVLPDAGIRLRPIPARISIGAVRWPERVIVGFLIYATAIALVLPVSPSIRNLMVPLNLALILTYGLLLHFDSARRMLATGVIRDWLPLGLILIAYREMGWLALPHHGHALEAHWVIWDRLVLRGGATAAIEAFGPVLPSALEIAYALVYALAPFSVAVLYLYGRRERVDTFLLIFALGVLLCYAQFPFWPSEPPRVVFFGQDFPAFDTVFRRFNLWMLGNYGIHTSVFPSAHVAGAFSAAFGMRQALPEHKWVSRFLYAMALLIAAATVYGRYHYLADAAAGFLVAVFVLVLQRYLVSSRAVTQPGASRSARVGMSAAGRAGFHYTRNADLYLSIGSQAIAFGAEPALLGSGTKNRGLEAAPSDGTQTMFVNQ
jgi:membrane-associated phospholipid phosphatase